MVIYSSLSNLNCVMREEEGGPRPGKGVFNLIWSLLEVFPAAAQPAGARSSFYSGFQQVEAIGAENVSWNKPKAVKAISAYLLKEHPEFFVSK